MQLQTELLDVALAVLVLPLHECFIVSDENLTGEVDFTGRTT